MPRLRSKPAPPLNEIAEKSPLRYAAVGTVKLKGSVVDSRYSSQLKKKNVLSWPLYNLGIHTGPPSVPPKSFRRFLGRTLLPAPSLLNGYPAFRNSFTK